MGVGVGRSAIVVCGRHDCERLRAAVRGRESEINPQHECTVPSPELEGASVAVSPFTFGGNATRSISSMGLTQDVNDRATIRTGERNRWGDQAST
jgi:hypothetical protein